MSSLWDNDDIVEDIPKRHKAPLADSDAEDSPRPTKRPRQTLFLPGSDDEDSDQPAAKSKARRPAAVPDKDLDFDAIFGDIDDLDDNMASKPLKTINADELERQLQAERRAAQPPLTPHQILSSSPVKEQPQKGKKRKEEDGEKKERRKPLHLNENLLAGENGFPQLIKNIKDFKPKGKGHEVKLSVWRDEFKGVADESEADSEDENQGEDMDAEPSAVPPRRPSVTPSNVSHRTSSPPAPPTSRPPSAASEYDDVFDNDFEALLQAEGSAPSTSISASTSASKTTTATTIEDDDPFWADMDMDDGLDAHAELPPPSGAKDAAMDEDEDMWDIVDQVNKESAVSKAAAAPNNIPPPSPPRPPPDAPQFADPSEWDDMYADE